MLNVPRFFPRLASALAVVSAVAAFCVPPSLHAQNPGRVDPTFNPGAGSVFINGTPVFGGTVYAISVDASNRVVVSGDFTSAVAQSGGRVQRNNQARYGANGILEDGNNAFNAGQVNGPDGPVFASAFFSPNMATSDLLIGGSFRRIQDTSRLRFARISGESPAANTPAGAVVNGFASSANDEVLAVAFQSGAPIIAGRFTSVSGSLVSHIARLNVTTNAGTPDTDFNIGSGADGDVLALAVNANNQIYLGGSFANFNSVPSARFARLNVNGDVDRTFSGNVGTGFNRTVRSISALANGQVLVAGDFTSYNGATVGGIVRLNADGTLDTTFAAGVGAGGQPIRAIAMQSDGSVIIGGDFTQFTSSNGTFNVSRVARLNATTGALDTSFNAGGTGANAPVFALAVGNGNNNVYVGGQFSNFNGATRFGFVRLDSAGNPDPTFNNNSGPGVGFTVQEVTALATASNGKIVVGGNFDSVSGSVNGRPRNFVERLNANGSPDLTFRPSRGPNNVVTALFTQAQTTPPDGSDDSIIILGGFDRVDDGTQSQMIKALARLGPTGQVDVAFQPTTDGSVFTFAPAANGGFLIAGDFRNVGAAARGNIARLTAAGTVDTSFNPGTGFNGPVDAVAAQPDGRILAGGRFSAFTGTNGMAQPFVARLLADGSFDTSFVAQVDNSVEAIAVQADGNIVIAGSFGNVGGSARNGLARLGINGRLDAGFNPNLNAGATVLDIAIQPDGRLLIAGTFTSVNGVARNNVARLNADGSLDTSFGSSDPTAGTNGRVETILRRTNGGVLIGGTFTSVDGQPRARLARLQGDQPPTTLQFSASVYTVNQVEGSATITVTRAGSTAGAVGVTYATTEGTATSGTNFQTVTGQLFWADGDGSPKTFTVPVFTVVNNGGPTNFTVNLTLRDVTGDAVLGTPSTAVLNITSESFGNVQFAATTFAARETDGAATITVTRVGGSVQSTVTVNYATSDTTGGAGLRYLPVSGTLTFGPNDTTPKTFTVPIINNNVRDGDQAVRLTLSATTGPVVIGSPNPAILVIIDDETPPAGSNASFSASTYSVREDAGSVAVVIVRTDAGNGRAAVTYATAEGSANAAGRFQPTTGTVIFEAGDVSPKIIRIPIINNAVRDGDATVLLSLTSTAGGATVPGGTATLTIVDDDAAPATLPTTFQFATSLFSAFETDGTATITVTRAGGPAAPFSASNGTVSVQYFVSDDTARLGVNYANTFSSPTSGTLVWTANDFTPKTFTVAILRDNLASGDVRVNVSLASPQSITDLLGNVVIPASLGTPNQASLRIVDTDLPAVLQFSQGTFQTTEDRGAAVINVIRTGGTGTPVAVAYSTGGGSAAPGVRYRPTSGTLSWAAGDTSPKSIVVPILQDSIVEPDQTVGLALGQIQGNALLGPQVTADLVITDDDGGQFFSVISVDSAAAPVATTDGKTKGLFFISRRDRLGNLPDLDAPLTVGYSARGTAMNGTEYRLLSGVVTIPAGQDSAQVKVKAINGGGFRMSTVKLILNPGANYFVNPAASRAKVKIVFPTPAP